MQVDLSGLRALVTGSTQGIGHAIAQKLATSGAEVVLNGRKAEDVRRAAERIRKAAKGCKLAEAPGDVATAAGVAEVIKAAGEIDILINNVGFFQVKDAFAITDEEWTQVFETNVLSGVRLTSWHKPLIDASGFLSSCATFAPTDCNRRSWASASPSRSSRKQSNSSLVSLAIWLSLPTKRCSMNRFQPSWTMIAIA